MIAVKYSEQDAVGIRVVVAYFCVWMIDV